MNGSLPNHVKNHHANGCDTPPDAGLQSSNHYKRALPKWRYAVRQKALPLIRWETPYLAAMQDRLRTPPLDSYFAITANLGTHTFFMIGLPILFWCGHVSLGKGLVHILGLGVFLTGFIKDFLSLPRPLSPPLHRITMSGSAALEYGFPSTHSANAVSVAVYGILVLHRPDNTLAPSTKLFLELLCYFYAVSIVFGRLYCGMHGFLDVIVGSAMGAAISIVEFFYGPPLDAYMHASSWMAPVIAGILIIALVRIHPEPADDCPCFDDSVAFASVFIGLEFATWTYGKIEGDPWETSAHANATIDVIPLGWMANTARIVFGVLIIFLWRGIMKPTMLRLLPHLFRLIERVGLSLPRRFFTPASEYKSVPPGSRIDTMLPSASDFPRMVESIRRPTLRGRSISVGPQSAADAYEALAYREFRRRQSNGKSQSFRGKADLEDRKRRKEDCLGEVPEASIPQTGLEAGDEGAAMLSDGLCPGPTSQKGSRATGEEQYEDRDVFSQLVKPRVRYDVEVVTKLVVYAGIAFIAAGAIPILFEMVGLGTNHLQAL